MYRVYFCVLFVALILTGQGCLSGNEKKPDLLPKKTNKNSELKKAFDRQWTQSVKTTGTKFGCLPDAMFVCSQDGCSAVEPSSYYIVEESEDRVEASKGKAIYKRCDVNGCNEEEVRAYQSGIFTQVVDNGVSLKIQTESIFESDTQVGSFSDVVSLFNTRMVSFGRCEMR